MAQAPNLSEASRGPFSHKFRHIVFTGRALQPVAGRKKRDTRASNQ